MTAAPTPGPAERGSLARRFLLPALPFAGAAAILALLFRRVPPERLLEALAGADLPRFFLALLPVSLAYVLLDAAVLHRVLRWFHPPGLRFGDTLAVRAIDYLVSLWNGRASQAAMVGALGRRFSRTPAGGGYLECAGTVLFLDLCQRAHLLLWAAIGALALGSQAPERVPVAAALGLAGLGLLVAFLRGRLAGTGLSPPRWRILRSLRQASGRRYVAVLALKAPLFLAAAIGHHLALGAFGLDIGVLSLIATLPVIFLAGALPIAVARVGTSQAAWLWFHSASATATLGAPAGEAALLAYSLSAHLTFLLLNAALSAPFLPAAWRLVKPGAGRRRPVPGSLLSSKTGDGGTP